MKSSTIKQFIENYIPTEHANKEIQNFKSLKSKHKFKYNKQKDLKNPSIKARRKPKYFNLDKNNLNKKKINSSSRIKKTENNKYKNLIYNTNNISIINSNRKELNKSKNNNSNGKNTTSLHERNLSAPDFKMQTKEDYNKYKKLLNKKKNQNITKINHNNNDKIDKNLINKDNYESKIETLHSDKNDIINLTYNNNQIIQISNKNNNFNNSLIKVNLTKSMIEDDEYNNFINSSNNLTMNNFYKKSNNKKQIRNIILDGSALAFSNFNKDLKNIQNLKDNITLLKEQLKKDEKKKEDIFHLSKAKKNSKLNNTINISNSTIKNINNNYNSSNDKNNNRKNIKNKLVLSNFHNYNQNILNKKKEGNISYNKINNNSSNINESSIPSNDFTSNSKKNLNIIKINQNNNLSNSTNNKTISISTNLTNINNSFGKKINLTNIYGGQNNKDDNDDKEITFFKENIESINNNDGINLTENNINANNPINIESIKKNNKKDNITINTELDNINIINKEKKSNNKNYKKIIFNDNKNIGLQRLTQHKDLNYLKKSNNSFSLSNQYNSFKNSKINKKSNNKIKRKDINFHNQNKNHKKLNKRFISIINPNNLFITNTLNNIDNIYSKTQINTMNNNNYYNFKSYHNNSYNKKKNKLNESFENSNRKKKIISKIKLLQNSKIMHIHNNISQDIDKDKGIKKRNFWKSYIKKDKNRNRSVGDIDDNMDNSKNKFKKLLSKCNFKYKSIYKIGVVSIAGEITFGEKKTNQDNFFNYLLNDNIRYIGVCDGHGEFGHHVSKYLRNYLPIELESDLNRLYDDEEGRNLFLKEISISKSSNSNQDLNSNNNIQNNNNEEINNITQLNNKISKNNIFEKMKNIFEASFSRTDKNLSEYCRNLNSLNTDEENIFDVDYSGSTCISILIKEKEINKIFIANVGDSRAIIIKELKDNYWTFQQLSRDHKPSEKDEAQRIYDYNGEIERIEDDDGNWTGPLRVWEKGSDGPGLAMTRSFGDEVGASVGVISTPEVGEYKIKEEDRVIIIASDGLWEYMSNNEVTDIVRKISNKEDPNFIVNELYKESVIRWRLKDQGIDDITIICILLKND